MAADGCTEGARRGALPSTPARLADGLGPKRLPYALRRYAPYRVTGCWVPRFRPQGGTRRFRRGATPVRALCQWGKDAMCRKGLGVDARAGGEGARGGCREGGRTLIRVGGIARHARCVRLWQVMDVLSRAAREGACACHGGAGGMCHCHWLASAYYVTCARDVCRCRRAAPQREADVEVALATGTTGVFSIFSGIAKENRLTVTACACRYPSCLAGVGA